MTLELRDFHIMSGRTHQTAQLHGREHIIVPIVALMEGVIRPVNGAGPEFVPADEISKALQAWNGRPIMPDHPKAGDGHVSANHPDVIAQSFGQVFNARMENNKLLMDAYIDVEKAKEVGAEAQLDKILAGDAAEVSVGVYVNAEKRKGTYDGKPFDLVWHHIVPDHLAVLPVGVRGACSVAMGCGTNRAAQEGAVVYDFSESTLEVAAFDKKAYMKAYNAKKAGKTVGEPHVEGPASHPSAPAHDPHHADKPQGYTVIPAHGGGLDIYQHGSPIGYHVSHEAAQEKIQAHHTKSKELLPHGPGQVQTTIHGNDVEAGQRERAVHSALKSKGFVKGETTKEVQKSTKMGKTMAYSGGGKSRRTHFTHSSGETVQVEVRLPKYGGKKVSVIHNAAPGKLLRAAKAAFSQEIRSMAFDKAAYMKAYNARKKAGGAPSPAKEAAVKAFNAEGKKHGVGTRAHALALEHHIASAKTHSERVALRDTLNTHPAFEGLRKAGNMPAPGLHQAIQGALKNEGKRFSGIDALKHPGAAMNAHASATAAQLKPGQFGSLAAKHGTYRVHAKPGGGYTISHHSKGGKSTQLGDAKNPQEAGSMITGHHASKKKH